ncbi:MAG: DJ-1/PfpI family protein [Spirochaetales bacterium]|nr:MAG: DJ-1/PfpI family protein [Spirochaetales bacterium]
MKTLALLLAPGFEEVEAVTPLDFLRRAGIKVVSLGIGGREVKGAHDITLYADADIKNMKGSFDGVVIPGGMPGASNIAASAEADALIRELFSAGKLVAAICASPAVVLAPKGLLKGKKATCYPGFEKDLQNGGADYSGNRVVRDGSLITSRGPGTAAEFAFEVISYLEGPEAAKPIIEGTLQK